MFEKKRLEQDVENKNYESDIKFVLKYARILLHFTGSWPVLHKQHWIVRILTRLYRFLGITLLLLVLIPLTIQTVFKETNFKLLFKNIGIIFILVVGLLKFFIIIDQSKNVQMCIQQMHVDWKETDFENRKIMLEYCKKAHSYTFSSTCFMYFCAFTWNVKEVLKEPEIIDDTPAYGLTYAAEFIFFNPHFVPQYYYIVLIQLLGSFVNITCMLNTLAISVSVVMHTCAQYKILTKHLETFGHYTESGETKQLVDIFPIIIRRHNHLIRYFFKKMFTYFLDERNNLVLNIVHRFSAIVDKTFDGIFFTEWINCSNGVWLCGYLFITVNLSFFN